MAFFRVEQRAVIIHYREWIVEAPDADSIKVDSGRKVIDQQNNVSDWSSDRITKLTDEFGAKLIDA